MANPFDDEIARLRALWAEEEADAKARRALRNTKNA
jgi:hypothetical protein